MISTTPQTTKDEDRFNVTWTAGSAVKRVEITNRETGHRTVGTDWANWDTAYRQALHQMFAPTISPSQQRV